MKTEKSTKRDMYYTKDHEWIDFQGPVAYVGICSFKLIGFREVQQIVFSEASGFKKRGELLAAVKYNDYLIEAHMPVDGNVVKVNTDLLYGDQNLLMQHAESSGWIALIEPALPCQKKDLLLPKEYHLSSRSKYVRRKTD